jgi:hypothetical protein
MNTKMNKNIFPRRVAMIAALLAGMILIPALRAQPTEQTVQNRFLFIFDTSRDMKACGAALEKTLNTLLATSLSGQLHTGDSMGVWTFGQDLRPGDYPLQSWNPDNAVMIASNLVKFVGNQHYGKVARFEALQPLLNKVVQNSERLTVLIFCDGEAKFSGTPFDDGINQIFNQKRNDQKSAGQPFIIVLRSQLGQYVGCSMGLPPLPLTYPQFPPLPSPPPAPAAKVTNAPPPPAPVVSGQPLIIVGTKTVSSPPPPKALPTNPPAEIKSAPPEAQTNAAAPPLANSVTTNLSAQITMPTNVAAPSSPSPAASGGKIFPIIAAGLVGAAIALGLVFWLRPRPKDPSLITRSMNDRK